MIKGRRLRIQWPPRTLKTQLLIYGAASVFFAVAVTAFILLRWAQAEARRQVQLQMLYTATALASALERVDPSQAQAILAAFHDARETQKAHQAWVVDLQGRIVAGENPRDIGRSLAEVTGHPEPALEPVLRGTQSVALDRMRHHDAWVLGVTVPLHGDAADPERITGALHYIVAYQVMEPLTRQLLLAFAPAALLLIVLLIVPLWIYLERSLLRPLRTLTAANRAIAEGRSEGRIVPEEAMPSHELGEAMRTRNEMLNQLEKADAEFRRLLRELSAFYSVAALLSETMTLKELLERTLDHVLEITNMDAGEISLFDPEHKRLVVHAHRGFPEDWFACEADRPTACLCGEVVYRAEPLCVSDISRDARMTRLACMHAGFRGFCAVPLRAEGQVLGVMSLHSRQARRLLPREQDLLMAIGNQVAVALTNIRLYAEVQRLATTDPLTGLANRRVFEQRLMEEARRARRYRRPLALIMADLDRFKVYNDTFGHPAGDAVLQEVASLLQANVRKTDLVARYGGEEFAILLPETSAAGALAVAEKIRVAVENHPFPRRETLPGGRLTISLGIAAFPEEVDEPEALIQYADEALYRAKALGGNRVSRSNQSGGKGVCIDDPFARP